MKRKIIAALVAAAFAGSKAYGSTREIIMDRLLQFDPNPTLITVSANSTNVLDMANARDMAIGEKFAMKVNITVLVALLAAGAATLRIQVQGSVDNVTFVTLCQTDDIPKANLTVGTVIELPIAPKAPHLTGLPRYYRVAYVVSTGPFTAGSVQTDLIVSGDQDNNPPTYAPGVAVVN